MSTSPDALDWSATLAPARTPSRDRAVETERGAADELLDLERGRTAALVAALGRLQASVDVLVARQARSEQATADALQRLEAAVNARGGSATELTSRPAGVKDGDDRDDA